MKLQWVPLLILYLLALFVIIYDFHQHEYSSEIASLAKKYQIIPLENNPELLKRNITDFYINTSHNTYIGYTQHGSITTTNPIRDALKMGCRCIELDISALLSYPIVAHGDDKIITTSYISLKNVLDTVVKYGFNTSDPLILCFELLNRGDTNMNKQIHELIKNAFGDKIFSPQRSFLTVPVSDLLGKVIITGSYTSDGVFDDMFSDGLNTIGSTDIDNSNSSGFDRIYRSDNGIAQILSFNLDPRPFWNKRYNMVSMNFQMHDRNLYENQKFFKNSSFMLRDLLYEFSD